MSRRVHLFLIAGCLVIVVLQAPSALRSLGEGWRGAYAAEDLGPAALGSSASARADATPRFEPEKSNRVEETSLAVLRAGF